MPNDIVVARDRRVYVVDSLEDCVKVYDERGRRIRVIGASGQGPGAFDFPSCLALSPDGSELYVGDQRNHRVQVFSLDGGWLRQFGAPLKRGRFEGCFGSIQSIATVMTASGQTLVHVLDASQNRVQILTHEGSYLTTYGQTGSMPGQFRLALDICVNRQGRILACDAGNRRIETIR